MKDIRLFCAVACALAVPGLQATVQVPTDVDVLVVGGTAAAVEAAVAAKAAGRQVCLMAPRPHLGEDSAGRLELRPIPVDDEPLAVDCAFRPSADGRKTRGQVTLPQATKVTRVELSTVEAGARVGTRECHFIWTADGKTWSSVTPLNVVMNYSPGGRYLWRAELNQSVKAIAVGATRADKAKKLVVENLRVFRAAAPGTRREPTPLEAKVALDKRLMQAGVPYLTGAMAIDVVRDSEGAVAGAVFATRGGRKTIRAKTVRDETVEKVLVKPSAVAPQPTTVRLSRVVLGGEKPSAPGLQVEELAQTWPAVVQLRGKAFPSVTGRLYRCTFDWTVDDTPLGWAAAEMKARELTWTKLLLDAADAIVSPVVPRQVYTDAHPFVVDCDVCVVGAGTAGAPATIAAARAGAKTVAVDYQYGLGGLGTMGMIGYYWYGTVCGFTAEVEKGIASLEAKVPGVGKREWWRREATAAGAQVLFGSMAYDVVLDGNRLTGVKVATPYGVVLVRCKVAVDATGAADLAAAAHEKTEYVGADELLMQSAGLPPRVPGFTYVNSDFGYVNDNDLVDTTVFARRGRFGAKGEWDVSSVMGSRERRRLVGDFQVQPEDVLNERTFPDTIATGSTDFDTHGPTVADVCFLSPATEKHVFKLNIPYRALLPAKTEGLLVCGLGASGHRDAMPFMRMQADVQNEGYAAGRAAAMAARAGVSPRQVDVKALQRHLADIGSIPKAALDWQDNFPLSDADWVRAVAEVADGFKGAPRVLTDKPRARRDLKAAFAGETEPVRRLALAQVLGMLGEPVGAEVLAANLKKPVNEATLVVADSAKRFGKRMGNRDAQLVALGRTKAPCAVPVIRAELANLKASAGLSHVRAVALAAADLADPTFAEPLAAVLRRKGVGGYACRDAAALGPLGGFTRTPGSWERHCCQRELHLARALYRCGDFEGLGRATLEAYAADPRGVYAAHARAVLEWR